MAVVQVYQELNRPFLASNNLYQRGHVNEERKHKKTPDFRQGFWP